MEIRAAPVPHASSAKDDSARFAQHADEHRPQRPVLLAVDQELGEGARLRWPKRGDARLVALGDEFDPMDGDAALRFLSAASELRPPEPDPPERVVIDPRLPGPDDPDTD